MPDKSKKFHEFALKSILFKGRADWYFCYLKTERIAHVLAVLAQRSDSPTLKDIAGRGQSLPAEIARLAGGELEPALVLADVFGLLSSIRIAATSGVLSTDNATVLVREYELVAERLSQGSHPSPFVGAEDFYIQDIAEAPLPLPKPDVSLIPKVIKDTKGQTSADKGQSQRANKILAHIRTQKSVSIKEVATLLPECSEKTVQRELNALIEQGLIRRVGERRWSLYVPA